MRVRDTECCAVREIYELSNHPGDPKSAMISFCTTVASPYDRRKLRTLYTFYIFTGVEAGLALKHYGTEFKNFILENGLGRVWETDGGYNRVNHPDHLVKVWVWAPDPTALNQWWAMNAPDDYLNGKTYAW